MACLVSHILALHTNGHTAFRLFWWQESPARRGMEIGVVDTPIDVMGGSRSNGSAVALPPPISSSPILPTEATGTYLPGAHRWATAPILAN